MLYSGVFPRLSSPGPPRRLARANDALTELWSRRCVNSVILNGKRAQVVFEVFFFLFSVGMFQKFHFVF